MSVIDSEEIPVPQTIDELADTVRQWSAEEASARRDAAAARRKLETAELSDAAGAYELMQQIEAAEDRATAAAAVAASTRRRLDEGRNQLAAREAAELQAVADGCWAAWRAHSARTLELLGLLRDHEGLEYEPPRDAVTEGGRLLQAAKTSDEAAMTAQLLVSDEYAVIRSGPAVGGERIAWIAAVSRNDGGRAYRPPFTVMVDGARGLSVPASPFDGLHWVQRTFPAGAVLGIAGQSSTFTEPREVLPAGAEAPR